MWGLGIPQRETTVVGTTIICDSCARAYEGGQHVLNERITAH